MKKQLDGKQKINTGPPKRPNNSRDMKAMAKWREQMKSYNQIKAGTHARQAPTSKRTTTAAPKPAVVAPVEQRGFVKPAVSTAPKPSYSGVNPGTVQRFNAPVVRRTKKKEWWES